MKKPISSAALTGALLASAVSVHAEMSASANVTLASDYVFRYVSQTLEEPAIQGGFDLDTGTGVYLGTWASNVDFGDDANIEIDFYGGYATEFENGLGIDVGVIDYEYFDDVANDNLVEVYGGLSYKWLSATAYFGVSNSLKDTGDTDKYVWLEAGVEYPVGPVTLSGTIGALNSDVADSDYSGWSIGASTDAAGLTFGLAYYDTDSDGEKLFGPNADGRAVFSISKEM
jgi:uncharacterized protein (TIGR02001 family)